MNSHSWRNSALDMRGGRMDFSRARSKLIWNTATPATRDQPGGGCVPGFVGLSSGFSVIPDNYQANRFSGLKDPQMSCMIRRPCWCFELKETYFALRAGLFHGRGCTGAEAYFFFAPPGGPGYTAGAGEGHMKPSGPCEIKVKANAHDPIFFKTRRRVTCWGHRQMPWLANCYSHLSRFGYST